MARFDVFQNSGAHAATTPYLLDVQSDLLQGLDTRVVVPLRLLTSLPGMQLPADLMPMFVVEGRECVMETPKLAAIPGRLLRTPVSGKFIRYATGNRFCAGFSVPWILNAGRFEVAARIHFRSIETYWPMYFHTPNEYVRKTPYFRAVFRLHVDSRDLY